MATLHTDALGDAGGSDDGHRHQRSAVPCLSRTPLAVNQAVHEVNADFGRDGLIATAATALEIAFGGMGTAAPDEVAHVITVIDFDRPFGLLAVERATRAVPVTAWVQHPDLAPALEPVTGRSLSRDSATAPNRARNRP